MAIFSKPLGRLVGEYWQQDNVKFDASNPGLVEHMQRWMNPVVATGSALGSVYDGIQKGNFTHAGLNAATLAFPMSKTHGPLVKAIPTTLGSQAWLVAKDLGMNALADYYQPLDISFGSPSKDNSAIYGRAAK